MQRIIDGVCRFKDTVFQAKKPLFEKLVDKQTPEALFITCADSRILPSLITQTEPGDLFILRNAGNLVPSYGASSGGEAATIEYAVAVLKVKHIIICGHSHCGAMKALIHSEKVRELPAVRAWFHHAESTRRILLENHGDLSPEELEPIAIRQNVLSQLGNLRTHPSVAAALARGELQLHGWVYHLESGDVFAFDRATEQFQPLSAPLGAPSLPGVAAAVPALEIAS